MHRMRQLTGELSKLRKEVENCPALRFTGTTNWATQDKFRRLMGHLRPGFREGPGAAVRHRGQPAPRRTERRIARAATTARRLRKHGSGTADSRRAPMAPGALALVPLHWAATAALDPNSTTVEVWVQAKNPKHRLKPGTSVQLSMLAQTIPDALVIPAASLLTADDGTTSVMLVGSDNRAHQKPVKTGVRQGDDVQILEGVQAGDRVVASGAYGLPDNTKIQIEPQKPQSDSNEKKSGGEEKWISQRIHTGFRTLPSR